MSAKKEAADRKVIPVHLRPHELAQVDAAIQEKIAGIEGAELSRPAYVKSLILEHLRQRQQAPAPAAEPKRATRKA